MIDKGKSGCCGRGHGTAKQYSSNGRWPLARHLMTVTLVVGCLFSQSYASLFSANANVHGKDQQPDAVGQKQFNRLQTAVAADPSIREYKRSGGFLSSLWTGKSKNRDPGDGPAEISDDSAEVIQVVFEGNSAKELQSALDRRRRAIFGSASGGEGIILEGRAEEEAGPWGPWVVQQECSRTCGGGVKVENRTCSGSACKGPTKRYMSCNTEECDGSGTMDFRAVQCSQYNDQPFEGTYYNWLPYLAKNKCELTCIPEGQKYYYPFKPKVADGTRCDSSEGGNGVCVDGLCLPLGCDGKLGSSMVEDKCGMCNGDGSSCKTIKGLFDTTRLSNGYHDIITIDAGATSITIHERRAFRNNYLAIRNETGGYYLNGDFKLDFPGTFDIAGTVFRYDREGNSDRLTASGPTSQELTFSLYQDETPSGSAVDYEYSIPLEEVQFEFTASPWSPCSVTCGEGVEERRLTCVDRSSGGRPVAEENCVNASMPEINRTCNTVDCQAEWFTGDWEECSSSCGDYGLQYRVVYCHQVLADGSHVTQEDSLCPTDRPDYQQTCNRFLCPEWNAGPWSSCSQPCGEAMQYRSVNCRSEKENEELKMLPASSCPVTGEPENARSCNLGPCEGLRWVTTPWKLCAKCNDTTEARNVTCQDGTGRLYPGEKCVDERPEDSRDCVVTVPCLYQWHASQWSECSTACGHGHKMRSVFCAIAENGHLTKMDASHCDPDMKVVDRKNCTNEANCTGTFFVSQWEQCSATCDGGTQSRSVVCLDYEMQEDKTACDESKIPKLTQECNTQSCDVCIGAEFGCCPDNATLATGPFLEGCSNCTDSEFGCCADNLTIATGAEMEGCGPEEPEEPGSGEGEEPSMDGCGMSEFGCCQDNATAATGPELEGCPEPLCNYTSEDGMTVEMACSNITDSGMVEMDNTTLSGNNTMTNETVELTCKDSEFGCCPDWFTEAEGPAFAGCEPYVLGSCNGTNFGCCPDELTLARGDDFQGCGQESCSASKFGCCDDRQTIAFGPHYEGCERSSLTCETSKWGCCPDGETAALGEKGEGCGEDCLVTKHGCCPDGITARGGPGGEGCGCATSQFGCCSDGQTKATGPQFRGCPDSCATTAFGCCPDGKTVQKGSHKEGCPCQFQRFGCCPDGETAARGLNHAGCDDCRLWKFGCCPDGVTKAQGQRYEGCFKDEPEVAPTVPTGPIAPEKIKACTLQSDVGTNCKQYQIQYFYNAKDGKCQQFWFGGCDGNLNRFATNEICERTCINPPGDGICHLPQSAGERSCGEPQSRVYFNSAMGQCEYFWFFCRGNGNSFANHDECYQTCGHIRDQAMPATPASNQPPPHRRTERPRPTAGSPATRRPDGQPGQPDSRRREEEARRRADYERQRQEAERRRAEEERRRSEEANRRRPPTGEIRPEGRSRGREGYGNHNSNSNNRNTAYQTISNNSGDGGDHDPSRRQGNTNPAARAHQTADRGVHNSRTYNGHQTANHAPPRNEGVVDLTISSQQNMT